MLLLLTAIGQIQAQSLLDTTFDPNCGNCSLDIIAVQADGKILVGGSIFTIGGQSRTHIARLNSDGTLDSTFNPNLNGAVLAIAVQTDGKILIGGSFNSVGGQTRNRIARLNSDGTLDSAFNPNSAGAVLAIAAQSDGKILIGGDFTTISGVTTRNRIARLNSDGSLDTVFNPNVDSDTNAIVVLSDGKILIGGFFTTVGGVARNKFARLNADGTLDTAFDANVGNFVKTIVVDSNGKIVIGGGFSTVGGQTRNRIARLNADGTLDTSFADASANGNVFAIAIQADGRILIGGLFTSVGGVTHNYVARLNSDGSLDSAFTTILNESVKTIAVQANGRILLGGTFTTVDGQTRNKIARLNAPISETILDNTFNSSVNVTIRKIVVQPDGKTLIGGTFTNISGQTRNYVARLNADGTLDSAFNPNANNLVFEIVMQADGKILIGGGFTTIGGQTRNYIARFNSDGTLDTTFVNSNTNDNVYAISVQSDGKILIGGDFTTVGGQTRNRIARLNSDGTLDTTFVNPNANSSTLTIVVQGDGKMLVGGYFTTVGGQTRNGIARLNADGTLDSSFNPNPNAYVQAIVVQTDGKILIGGAFTTIGGQTRNYIARLNANGTLDFAFNPNANGDVYAITVQSYGKILIGGDFTTIGGQTRNRIARLNSDGTLDAAFNPNTNNIIYAIAIQSDGNILIGGTFTSVDGQTRNRIARLIAPVAEPMFDTAFNPNANDTVFAIAVQADGKILVGGFITSITGQARSRIARLNADGTLDSSFNPNADFEVRAIVVQEDGKILIGGDFTAVGGQTRNKIARLNADGTLDSSFNPNANNRVATIVVQDGKILIGGTFTSVGGQTRTNIARLNADGTLDPSFVNPVLNEFVSTIALQPDGKILIGGQFTSVNGQTLVRVARLNANGTLDDTFFPPIFYGVVETIALQTDGKILVGGSFIQIDAQTRNRIARLNSDGTLDCCFNPNADNQVNIMVVQPNGKILVGGSGFTSIGGQTRNRIARLNSDGTLDLAFDPNANNNVFAIALQTNGKVLIGGDFTTLEGQPRNRIARLSADLSGSVTPCVSNPIAYGQSFTSALTSGSCVANARFNDTYSFTGTAGDQLAVTLESAFSSAIELLDAQNNVIQSVGLGGTFTSLRLPSSAGYFTLPATGTYTVKISSNFQSIGVYTLSLYKAPPVAAPPCTYSLSSPLTNVESLGGTFFIDILTQEDCPPASVSLSPGAFYTIDSFIGSRLTFTVSPNSLSNDREGAIIVGALTHTVFQYRNPAANNNPFAAAELLSGNNSPVDAPVTGYNTNATSEVGEPAHDGKPASRSVWYKWTSPGEAGLYSFSTSGSDFDTVMAIYACPTSGGCSLSSLIAVGSSDDTTEFDKTSKVNFRAAANTTYYIAIDGKKLANNTTDTGALKISWRQYERLYRIYLQNFNGDPSPLVPDSVTASSGSKTVTARLVSQGVYEFNLPADNNVYIVHISGPAGIVWNPNNYALGSSFTVQNAPTDGETGTVAGENIVSNATNQTPRYFNGLLRGITTSELPLLSVMVGYSRGPNPLPPDKCTVNTGVRTLNSIPYAQYQCPVQPNTLHDIIPAMEGKRFTAAIYSPPGPLVDDVFEIPPTVRIGAENAVTFNISGRVAAGGAGTTVNLVYQPIGMSDTITVPTKTLDDTGYYEFKNLAAGNYRLRALRTGFVFIDPAEIALQSSATVDIAVEQACTYEPAQSLSQIAASGGASSFNISTNNPTCGWSAVSQAEWIVINSGSAIGPGSVQLTVAANSGTARSGIIKVGGQNIIINQAAPAAPAVYSIDGAVTYGTTAVGAAAKQVPAVNLSATGSMTKAAVSGATGSYQLNGLPAGNYTVTPSKTGDINNSISSFDASLVARKAANLVTLTPNQMIAADASGNGQVTSFDASFIARTAAGIPNTGVAGQWRFVPGSTNYQSLNSNKTGENYEAILMGEVSGNWTAPTQTPAGSGLEYTNRAEAMTEEERIEADRVEEKAYFKILKQFGLNQKPDNYPGLLTETQGRQQINGLTGEQATINVSLPANTTASSQSAVVIPVMVTDTTGQEIFSYDFTLTFNQAILTPTTCAAAVNSNTLSGASGFTITTSPGTGSVTISGFGSQALAGAGTLVNLCFNVTGTSGVTNLAFSSFVFNEGDPGANAVGGTFRVMGTTAATVGIGGRVMTTNGKGIRNIYITLTDADGNVRITRSTAFGYYRFEDVEVGQTYVLSARGKRYQFNQQAQARSIYEEINDINFIGYTISN